MNSSSIYGIFAFLLFAYYTPTQSQVFTVRNAILGNSRRFNTNSRYGTSTRLIKLPNDFYELEERRYETAATRNSPYPQVYGTFIRARFQLKGIDTMLDKLVVAITDDNSYFEVETRVVAEAQRLFNVTTLPKLGETLYSYEVFAVYEYRYGSILQNVSISGFKYPTAEEPKERYIIHAGKIGSSEMEPYLLWTERDFYYFIGGTKSIILTLNKPPHRSYRYYLVEFVDASNLASWIATAGEYYSNLIPAAPPDVVDDLRRSS